MSRNPASVSPRLSKNRRRLTNHSTARDSGSGARRAEHGRTEQHPAGLQDGRHVLHRGGLPLRRPPQAVQHVIQRRGVERLARWHGQRLQHVRLERPGVQVGQAPGGMGQHIPIRVQQRDLRVACQPGVLEEVPGTRADIEVPVPDVPRVVLHQPRGGAPPHDVAIETEDQRVVDPQERAAVQLLPRVGRVRRVHDPFAGGGHDVWRNTHAAMPASQLKVARSNARCRMPRHARHSGVANPRPSAVKP